MPEPAQIGMSAPEPGLACAARSNAPVLWSQSVTLAWMLVEFGVAAYAAARAHSPVLAAFGSDSLIELLSAAVVMLQWVPGLRIAERTAARAAGTLLFALAFVVAAIAVGSLTLRLRPETSGPEWPSPSRADRNAGAGGAETPRGPPPDQGAWPPMRCNRRRASTLRSLRW